MQRYGAPKVVSDIGNSRTIVPVSHSRFRCDIGSNAIRRNRSSIPIPRSTFIAFGSIWMPAPTRANCRACSYTWTSAPMRRNVAATAKPPMPAPTIAMEMLLLLMCDANLTDCDAFPKLEIIVAADDTDHTDGFENPRLQFVVPTYHPPRTPKERCRVCCRAAHILN